MRLTPLELEKLDPLDPEDKAPKAPGNPLQMWQLRQVLQGKPRDPSATYPDLFHAECVTDSAIDPSLYAAAIDFVTDTGSWEPYEALGWQISRNWQKKPHSFDSLACFRQESGELWQAKPLNPRLKADGSTQKYEAPKGAGSTAYLPPIPLEIRQRIGDRYKIGTETPTIVRALYERSGLPVPDTILSAKSFWGWVEQNPSVPIVITEGGKKALSLLSQGYVAISLYGVNGGYRANETIAGEKVRLDRPELIDSLKPFISSRRKIILAFDQDTKWETRQKVAGALFNFGRLLKSHGAEVSIASWDGNQGKGIDDLRVNAGQAAVSAALAESLNFEEWAIGNRLANRVSRKPDRNIGDQEFVAVADSLPKSGIAALLGGKGTGKSKAIAQTVKGRSWLSITGLISLSREQAESFGGHFINDIDHYRGAYLKEGQPVTVNGLAVCVPSLLKAQDFPCEVLILDETTAVLKFLLESKLANKEGMRPLLLTEFDRRVKEAELVVLADADLTEEAIAYIEKIRGERTFLVRSNRQPLQWSGIFLEGKRNEAIAALIDAGQQLAPGTVLYINTDSKKLAETLSDLLLQEIGIKSLLITQATSGGEIERSFLQSKGADLPSLVMAGIQAIITSPSVCQGFSIEHHTHLITGVWGFYQGASIDAVSIAQSLDRLRSPLDRQIWIAEQGRAYSRFSNALNSQQWLLDFHQAGTATVALARLSLRPETLASVEALDWQSKNIQVLASFETERNRGMIALKATVKALLRNEGKRILARPLLVDPNEDKRIRTVLKGIAERLEHERALAVVQAPTLTDDAVKALEAKSQAGINLTPEEIYSLEQHYLTKFYRLSEVTPADVLFDHKGVTRKQIERLESLVIEGRALERTASSIHRNPTTPQDWDKSETRRWLLEVSGAMTLIQAIWAGRLTDLSDEVIAPIAAILKAHAQEFALAFNFRGIDKVEDRQAVFTLLDYYGLKRVSKQIRIGGERDRAYSVDRDHLEQVRGIITKRSEPVTPPPEETINQGGVTSDFPPEFECPGSVNQLEVTPPDVVQSQEGGCAKNRSRRF